MTAPSPTVRKRWLLSNSRGLWRAGSWGSAPGMQRPTPDRGRGWEWTWSESNRRAAGNTGWRYVRRASGQLS